MYGYLFEDMTDGQLGRHRDRVMRRHRGRFPFFRRRFLQPWWYGPEQSYEQIPVLVRVTDGTGRVREMRSSVAQDRLMEALDVAHDQITGTIPARNVIEIFSYGRLKVLAMRVYDNTLDEILRVLGLRAW